MTTRSLHRLTRTIPGGGDPGEIIDTSGWKHAALLVDQRYMSPIELAVGMKGPKCACGRRWADAEAQSSHEDRGCVPAPSTPDPVPAA
jgi:hypothetical protein